MTSLELGTVTRSIPSAGVSWGQCGDGLSFTEVSALGCCVALGLCGVRRV